MVGILDIAPPEITAERINIRGTDLEVRGIRNRDWAGLLRRFPELRKQAAGVTVSDEEMALASIEVMPAVIAAGLGNPGDEKTEILAAERLTDAEQAEVFGVIMRLTMPPSPLAESPAEAGRSSEPGTETSMATQSSI